MSRRPYVELGLVVVAVAVFALWGRRTEAPAPSASGTLAARATRSGRATYTAAPAPGDIARHDLRAVIETKYGPVAIKLYPKEAPNHVASFVALARDGFYDGLTFHRVVPHFVVQGGDPTGTGQGGPGYTLGAEFNDHLHKRGTVAMARAQDPNSAGSQFYICLEPQSPLDHQYTVFGDVVSGMEAVDKIKQGDKMWSVRIEDLGTPP